MSDKPQHVMDREGLIWRVVRDGGMATRADFTGITSIGIAELRRTRSPLVDVEAALDAVMRDEDDMCPNCVTPWKCNSPHSWGWPSDHNDSCRCHIGICADCGCTNEAAPPEPITEDGRRINVERLAEALKVELNRTHMAGEYGELAEAIAAEYTRLSERTDR